jgi:hypothetical protein
MAEAIFKMVQFQDKSGYIKWNKNVKNTIYFIFRYYQDTYTLYSWFWNVQIYKINILKRYDVVIHSIIIWNTSKNIHENQYTRKKFRKMA